MGKLDKVLDVATPIAKEAAKETAKLTGKGIKLAGKGIKEAGSKAVANYKETKRDQLEEKLSALNEKFSEGIVLCAFDTGSPWDKKKVDKLGIGIYAENAKVAKLAKILVDDNNELHYKAYGDYENTIKRYFSIHDRYGNKIGSVNEHSKLFGYPYETVKYKGEKMGNLNHKYIFDNTSYIIERVGTMFSPKHFTVHTIVGLLMEIEEVRGQEFIAIADKKRMDECALLYMAIDLIWRPKPEQGEA